MDPITQGVLGASAALSITKKEHRWQAAIAGTLGGMLADADVFIQSAQDPLLKIEYHRHFTHSLAFIPIGGLIAAAFLWIFLKRYVNFKELTLYSVIGYATHGLLDACTSYGTQLLQPFSNLRVAWNIISIVDPVYTILLILGIVFTLKFKKIYWARLGLILSAAYLLFGVAQRERALDFQAEVASQRGHIIQKCAVHPTFGNLVLWRSVYESQNGTYNVDALRLGLFSANKLYEGTSVPKVDPSREWPSLSKDSVLYKDILRFEWFSGGWLYRDTADDGVVSDLRYSLLPQKTEPLWGIEVDPSQPERHAPFLELQKLSKRDWRSYQNMLQGR